MSDLWLGIWMGFLLGIVASVIVSYFWELRDRLRLYGESGKLVGTWTAYNVTGRMIDKTPMPGAGLTVVTRKSGRFSARAGVLDVQCQDIDVATKAIREHSGQIVLDRFVPWTAMRIDRYDDSSEICEQRLVLATDPDVVYIFPSPTVASMIYTAHAWRRGDHING
jgi:hypothetical protein